MSALLVLIPLSFSPATLAGLAAVSCCCVWPLLNVRRRILGVQVLSSMLFSLHYGLLGAETASAMCLAGAVQGVAANLLRSPRARLWAVGATVALSLVVTVLTWHGLPSVLAQIGQILSAVGRLQRRPQAIRLSFLGSEVFWTSHNLLVGSTWGLMADTFSVSMILLGLWRGWRRYRVARAHFPRLLGRRAQPA